MNGILARMGLKQLVLILLALVAVIAVLADLGGAFWTAWFGAAGVVWIASKWRLRGLATGVD